jgi:hypothetical protein
MKRNRLLNFTRGFGSAIDISPRPRNASMRLTRLYLSDDNAVGGYWEKVGDYMRTALNEANHGQQEKEKKLSSDHQ